MPGKAHRSWILQGTGFVAITCTRVLILEP